MNIKLMKELAELNTVKKDVDARLSLMIDEKINETVQQVKNDFSAYFKSNGFSVNENGNVIIATYKDLSIKLSHDTSASKYMGSYFVFDLDTVQVNKDFYNISLIRTGVSTQSHVTLGFVDEDQQQLNSVRAEIEQALKRIDNFTQEKWVLTLSKKSKTGRESHTYVNMSELLNDLFK